jgi:DinB superfamily
MDSLELEKMKYPIGNFKMPESFSAELKAESIRTIVDFPKNIKKQVSELTEAQLDTPYRPEGWTIRQLVHHCADSHMNAFIRFKLALTEDKPTVKAYEEQLWAEQADYKLPVEVSLNLIEALHTRWATLLASLTDTDFEAKYIHPQSGKELNLNYMLALYNWHCKHHLAHITELKKRMGW